MITSLSRSSISFVAPRLGLALAFAFLGVSVATPEDVKPASEVPPAAPTAPSESDKAAEDMARTRADLLSRHQGADETRLTQLMGPPTERGTKDSELTLVWRGPAGAGDPLPCRLSATLVEGGLANLEISGTPSWDRKTCKKFLRPLLQALPWKSVEHSPSKPDGTSASLVLANETIVRMVREGLPAQAILARIQEHPCKFDVSPEGTSALRRNNVPEALIQAMAGRSCT